jgi:hypothetical protein
MKTSGDDVMPELSGPPHDVNLFKLESSDDDHNLDHLRLLKLANTAEVKI